MYYTIMQDRLANDMCHVLFTNVKCERTSNVFLVLLFFPNSHSIGIHIAKQGKWLEKDSTHVRSNIKKKNREREKEKDR